MRAAYGTRKSTAGGRRPVESRLDRSRPPRYAQVNALLEHAASGRLAGILGFEERPLVSVDYLNDPRSAIIDGLSTMVTNGTQVKILAWYDNEWGYANRYVELARIVVQKGGL